jgi:indole-3-glycerol phosphate synthase
VSDADLLGTIVAATRRSVAIRQLQTPLPVLEKQIRGRQRGHEFTAALRNSPPPRIIAECKRRSPSSGILRQRYDPAEHAREYASAEAAAISVLTEPTFFDGAPDHLSQVRAAVSLPLLRKDFIVSYYQLVESAALGADAVLLIAAALDDKALSILISRARGLGLAALVEVHNREELERVLNLGAEIVGVNSRDLRTLSVNTSTLEELIPGMPPQVTSVAESGIRTCEDVTRLSRAGYHAFLVGERLIAQADPGAALRELRAVTC